MDQRVNIVYKDDVHRQRNNTSRISSTGSVRRRQIRRRLAYLTGLLLCGALAAALGAGAGGCGPIDYCDPSIFPMGTADPAYLDQCTSCGLCEKCRVHRDCDLDHYTDYCILCSLELADAGSQGGDGGAEDAGDAAADAPIGTGTGACAGRCLPVPPNGWELPSLVWMGAEVDAPPCPEAAPALGFEGRAGLVAPSSCGSCQCAPPEGTCRLPVSLTAAAGACTPDPGAAALPFDAPAGWDGSCTAAGAVPADLMCGGGPCVQSLTIAPMTLDEAGCEPVAHVPDTPPVSWQTFARGCRGVVPGACATYGFACSPADVPGFRACVYQPGETSCPEGSAYSEKHVFYHGFTDDRACSPCTCGAPTGSGCSAQIAIYPDGACASDPSYVETIGAGGPQCHDLVPGAPLGSKSATAPVYTPGACAAGGGSPLGSAAPVGPSTLCCLPSP